uniref:Uncharacterized protein n=1 Tax=Knipowitschia caucasica TaxID=637954 RepID=A0AAV2KLZ1_KNICA
MSIPYRASRCVILIGPLLGLAWIGLGTVGRSHPNYRPVDVEEMASGIRRPPRDTIRGAEGGLCEWGGSVCVEGGSVESLRCRVALAHAAEEDTR